jgi:hypothetical protein
MKRTLLTHALALATGASLATYAILAHGDTLARPLMDVGARFHLAASPAVTYDVAVAPRPLAPHPVTVASKR